MRVAVANLAENVPGRATALAAGVAAALAVAAGLLLLGGSRTGVNAPLANRARPAAVPTHN